jgi:hypothetical protein
VPIPVKAGDLVAIEDGEPLVERRQDRGASGVRVVERRRGLP